jgi:hypothetical protein
MDRKETVGHAALSTLSITPRAKEAGPRRAVPAQLHVLSGQKIFSGSEKEPVNVAPKPHKNGQKTKKLESELNGNWCGGVISM